MIEIDALFAQSIVATAGSVIIDHLIEVIFAQEPIEGVAGVSGIFFFAGYFVGGDQGLHCRGRAAHSGSPELGQNATWPLLDWLQRLREQPRPEDPLLGPELWNLGLLKAGQALNSVPAEAEAHLLARTVPGSVLLDEIRRLAPPEATVDLRLDEPPDTYPEIPGFPMAAMPFGSDAPALRILVPDRTVVLAGPGSITVAHTLDEHLALAELEAGIDLNRRLALHFLGD